MVCPKCKQDTLKADAFQHYCTNTNCGAMFAYTKRVLELEPVKAPECPPVVKTSWHKDYIDSRFHLYNGTVLCVRWDIESEYQTTLRETRATGRTRLLGDPYIDIYGDYDGGPELTLDEAKAFAEELAFAIRLIEELKEEM